jgi:hypothetical protein
LNVLVLWLRSRYLFSPCASRRAGLQGELICEYGLCSNSNGEDPISHHVLVVPLLSLDRAVVEDGNGVSRDAGR